MDIFVPNPPKLPEFEARDQKDLEFLNLSVLWTKISTYVVITCSFWSVLAIWVPIPYPAEVVVIVFTTRMAILAEVIVITCCAFVSLSNQRVHKASITSNMMVDFFSRWWTSSSKGLQSCQSLRSKAWSFCNFYLLWTKIYTEYH